VIAVIDAQQAKRRKNVKRALVVLVLLAVCVYVWAYRTGRYTVTRLDQGIFVVLDTANGEHWIYAAHRSDDKPTKDVKWSIVDRAERFSFYEQVR
jgi:hypothetical protein